MKGKKKLKQKKKKEPPSTSSNHSVGSSGSNKSKKSNKSKSSSLSPPARRVSVAAAAVIKRNQQTVRERQKLAKEILAEKPKGPTYTFKDTTKELAQVPEKLEIHPTKTAPTLSEIENRLAREREHEKLKFFTVPIKMYDTDENGAANLNAVNFTDEDKIELNRYGSRVVMREDGRIAAMEVQQDIMNQFNTKRVQTDFCQCLEKEYEVSEKLRTNDRVRRVFMAKVLTLETLLRLPSLVALYYQKEYTQLHDFIYQQNLLIFFMIAIVQGTRLAGIYFSEVGRYEPCRTIITVLTMTGYCMMSVLMTALLQQFSILYIDYKLYEDAVSLETLQRKRVSKDGLTVSYPYVVFLMITYLSVVNSVMAFFLFACNKRIMNELKNGFLLITFITFAGLAGLSYYFIIIVKIPFLSKSPIGWDNTQILFSILMTAKWAMWRFYMLQLVVKGKSLKVSEDISQYVSLNFAI